MSYALAAARKALAEGAFPVGAVAVVADEIVGTGVRSENDFYFGHAEVRALQAALATRRIKRPEGLTIYSTLEPCILCLGAILHCPVRRVVYALEDPWGGATRLCHDVKIPRHTKKLPKVESGVSRSESLGLLRDYFKTTTEPCWQDASNPLLRMAISQTPARRASSIATRARRSHRSN